MGTEGHDGQRRAEIVGHHRQEVVSRGDRLTRNGCGFGETGNLEGQPGDLLGTGKAITPGVRQLLPKVEVVG
jgi:hypothetical protein